MCQTGVLVIINEVLFNSSLHFIACITVCAGLAGTIIENNGSMGVRLGLHIQRTITVVLLVVVLFIHPVIGSRHRTGLHLVLLLNVNTVRMHHLRHVQTVLTHLVLINVNRAIIIDHAAVSRRVAARVHIVPVSAIIIDLADSAGEPGVLIAGVIVLGLSFGFDLNIVGMGRIVVLVISRQIVRRNNIALAIGFYLVDIAVIQRVDVVNGLCPHLAHSLGRYQEVAVVDCTFTLNAILGDTFYIDVIIAGIHIEPVAHHLIVRIIGSRSILNLDCVEIVHIVECTAAKAFTGNGGLSSIRIEHDLVKVNNVAALGINLSRSTPLAILCINLGECSLNQVGISRSISQTDTTVVISILNGGKLIAQQRTKCGHLDRVIITAGTGNIQHGAHVEHSIFCQPVMEYQHLLNVGSITGQFLHSSNSCITHCKQFATVVVDIGHECLGQHLHQLDHLCRRNVLIGIQVTQNLQCSHGVSFGVLGSPIVGRNTKVISLISIESRQDRIVVRNLSSTIILRCRGIHTNDLDIAVGIQNRITLCIHHISRDPVTILIQNGVAIRSNQRTIGIVNIETDLHIGVEQIVIFQSLACCESRSLANIASNGFISIQVDPDILSHGEVSHLIFLSLGIIHDNNILTTCGAVERNFGQLVVNISQNAFRDRTILGIINQTAICDSLSIIFGHIAFAVQELALLIGTELRSIILSFNPSIIHNTGTGGQLNFVNDCITQCDNVSNIDLAVAVDISDCFCLFINDLVAQGNNVTNVEAIIVVEVTDHLCGNSVHGACSIGIRIQQLRMTGDGTLFMVMSSLSSGINRDLDIKLVQFLLQGIHSRSITLGHIEAHLGDLIVHSGIPQILNSIIQIVFIQNLSHELRHILLAQAKLGNINTAIREFTLKVSCNGCLDRVIRHFSGLFHSIDKGLIGLVDNLCDVHCTKILDRIANQRFSTGKRVQSLRRYFAGLNSRQTGNDLRSGCGSRNGCCDCRQGQNESYANR